MRRASTCLAVLALAVVGLASTAQAAPTVTLKAVAVPIKGYPHTGNIFGAGAALEVKYSIKGTEYGGFPPPLIGVNFYLPTGAKLHPAGFKTCPEKTISEEKAPENCPKGSAAGPVGKVDGVVAFGGTRVHESIELLSFFRPGGGLEFFAFGHTPTTIEIPSLGSYTNLGGGGGFGPKFITKVPLVETVPGAPYGSVESINVKVGAAYKKGGKAHYYGTLPTSCPKHFLLVKSELIFAHEGNESEPETVTVEYHAPCPRKH